MKKKYYILILPVIVLLFLNVTFANEFSGENSANNMIVDLSINYGQVVTENSYVTLSLEVKGENIDLNGLKVQFSSDNQTWFGYNPFEEKWQRDILSKYRPFYPNFYIGSSSGVKTVYVKVIDNKGNIGFASAQINFSTSNHNPFVKTPYSIELEGLQSPLTKAGIKGGSGSLYDPYIISNNNTRLISKIPNATEVSYYTEKSWSPWYPVENEEVDIPIVFNNVEGEKEVRLRIKNQYGVEGSSEIIYYLLDSSNPVIDLYTNYHSFTAIAGRLEADLEIYDSLSNIVNFTVELYSGESKIMKEGKVQKLDDKKSTILTVIIEGIPEGKFNLRVTAIDKAGNKSTKEVKVISI